MRAKTLARKQLSESSSLLKETKYVYSILFLQQNAILGIFRAGKSANCNGGQYNLPYQHNTPFKLVQHFVRLPITHSHHSSSFFCLKNGKSLPKTINKILEDYKIINGRIPKKRLFL
ncbi:MAG: hypothetical protein DRR19_01170 [Candidatus Parabeggiatoa sp. nov. 1]|nr:MAG: hypothetical protein DRR19_01170 [Gammaproteobacteria bacterium]